MNIGIDYDNTITADPVLYQNFISLIRERGHKVYVVTARPPDAEIEFVPNHIEGVIYCSLLAKKTVTDSKGIKIDNWIDDHPEYIIDGV